MSQEVFRFSRQGRSNRAAVALGCVYAVLALGILRFDAAWWIVALVALFTLPAAWDFWRNPSAGLELDTQRLSWHTGNRKGQLDLAEIDHMRFDTRWDLSVRVAAVLPNKKRVRLPYESLPKPRVLEQEFQARDITVKRHHFTIF